MKIILVATLFVLVAGCTTIGSSDFKCGGIEAGVKCTSVSEMYKQTTENQYSADRGYVTEASSGPRLSRRIGGKYRYKRRSHNAHAATINTEVPQDAEPLLTLPIANRNELIFVTPPEPDMSIPEHNLEVKERVWLNEFVDVGGSFVGSQKIYFASRESGWEARQVMSTNVFQPLKSIVKKEY